MGSKVLLPLKPQAPEPSTPDPSSPTLSPKFGVSAVTFRQSTSKGTLPAGVTWGSVASVFARPGGAWSLCSGRVHVLFSLQLEFGVLSRVSILAL